MIPPKKSKAARENTEEEEPTENGDPKGSTSDVEDEPVAKKPKKNINIFTEPLVEGKRPKQISPVEALLYSWINENLESKAGTRVQRNESYDCYLASCANKGISGVDHAKFLRAIDETFPEGHTVRETSVYRKKIKEARKIQKKKEKTGVKGETLKIKMKDIITGALQDLGNPKNGVRFHNIKKYIAAHFPALQIDFKPETLKSALNRGVYYGHIILVKGIGKAGFYRLPGKAGDEDEEEKEKPSADGEKKEKKKEGGEGEEKSEGEVNTEEDGVKEGEPETAKRTKRKATTKAAGPKEKKKKKSGKKSAPRKAVRKFVIHSDPQRVQDCFPLAFTYMAEPKQVGVLKIKKYIRKFYHMKRLDDRLPKVLEDGLEKGWWSNVSGSKTSGVYRLEMAEYDATADDDLIGMVMNAIVACNEPKVCSARVLKDYIVEYHPDLKVAERPHLFKNALFRAVSDGSVKQLTGIGLCGSFKYAKPFTASPVVLQGADDEDDYDSDGNELIAEGSDDSEDSEDEQPNVTVYFDAYVPRPSKRGHSRAGAAGVDLYSDRGSVSTAANRIIPKSVKKVKKTNKGGKASKDTKDLKGKGKEKVEKKSKKGRKPKAKEGKEEKEAKEPKERSKGKASKKGKRPRGDNDDADRKTSKRAKKNVSYTEDADDESSEDEKQESEEEAEEPEPASSKSRRKDAKSAKGKSAAPKGKKKGKKSKGRRG